MQNSQVQSMSAEIVNGYRFAIATMDEGFFLCQFLVKEQGEFEDLSSWKPMMPPLHRVAYLFKGVV